MLVLLGALLVSAPGFSAPYRPTDDDAILVRLPGGAQASQLASLRRAAESAPGERGRARALARSYLDLGRRQGEPRLVAYAATVIEPLTRQDPPDPDDLVLAATAAQYLHDFDEALRLLDRALAIRPLHAQALLTQAGLLEVRGDYRQARATCARLVQASGPLIAVACLTSVDSRSGHLGDSYSRLQGAYQTTPGLAADVDSWMLGMLADMAERRGDVEAQGRHLARARERAPDDLKIEAAFADWALARGEWALVLALAPTAAITDPLLLRLAIAAKHAGDPRAAAWAMEFRERQGLAAGDSRHLREWARFALEVDGDATTAVRWARENWAHQREPEDVRLLLRAAKAAKDSAALNEVQAWIKANAYEDRSLT